MVGRPSDWVPIILDSVSEVGLYRVMRHRSVTGMLKGNGKYSPWRSSTKFHVFTYSRFTDLSEYEAFLTPGLDSRVFLKKVAFQGANRAGMWRKFKVMFLLFVTAGGTRTEVHGETKKIFS